MASQTEIARENYDRYAYARQNGHLAFIEKDRKCNDYFKGVQWDENVKRSLERRGRPALTINKVLSTCAAVFGEQLRNRADVTFRAARNGTDETATALAKTWVHFANSNMYDWKESEVAADGFIGSRGFFDLRVSFDDHMMGEAQLRVLNPNNVVIDSDAESYDPDEWREVFVTKWFTADEVERNYGADAATELRGRTGSGFMFAYDSIDQLPDSFGGPDRIVPYGDALDLSSRRIHRIIERQFKELRRVEHFVDLRTGDMRPVPDTWDRNRIAYVASTYNLGVVPKTIDVIRWVTSVDNLVLHNERSPFKHFTPVPYFPFFRRGATVGIVENLMSPQDLLNKATSQELHVINTTANSGYKTKRGNLKNMSIEELEARGAETGLVIELEDINQFEKIQPNQIPTGLDRLGYLADEHLKEISMVSDSMRGFDRADVAAKAIQAKQVRGTVNLAKPFDNLAFTRHLVARNLLDILQEFYTEERILNITGRDLTAKTEEFTINQVTPEGTIINDLTVGEYQVVVTTVPARDTFEQSQFQEALELRQLGIAIPDDVLVEHSHLDRKSEIAKRIQDAQGGGEPSAAAQQLEQLDLQLKQLEALEKQANTQVKQANAALSAARAQKELKALSAEGDPKAEAQMQTEAAKLVFEREKFMHELELRRQELAAEIQLKREQAAAELQLKREQYAAEQHLKQVETAARIRANNQTSKEGDTNDARQ